jgi:hypothetical protein
MKETSAEIRSHKLAIEKLAVLKRELTREQEEREAKGKRDERAEEGCRWSVTFSFPLIAEILQRSAGSRVQQHCTRPC